MAAITNGKSYRCRKAGRESLVTSRDGEGEFRRLKIGPVKSLAQRQHTSPSSGYLLKRTFISS